MVAPPLHAPLRFANVATSSVLTDEVIDLGNGSAEVEAQAWEGDGWLECQLQPEDDGYRLRALFRCLPLDSQQVQEHHCDWLLR